MRRASRSRIGRGIGLLSGIGLSLAAGAGVHARFRAPYQPRLECISVAVPPGHESLAGLRIAFVTDTHFGPSMSLDDIRNAMSLTASCRPDLILFGGDYISESPRYCEAAAVPLGELASAAPHRGVAVLGNHDIAMDADRMTRALQDVGIPVLRNQSVCVETGRGPLWIAGVDESMLGHPNLEQTFRPIPPDAAIVTLWHEPDYAQESARRGAFAQLSGHSHGGQIKLPFLGTPGTPAGGKRYVEGLCLVDGMPVYTSRGVGVYRPPIRVNCPPEVTLVTLIAPRR